MMRKGIKVRLDPTPRQERLLASNAGAARYVFNLGLMHIKSQLNGNTSCDGQGKADWSMPALRRWWNAWKQELAPWWRENSKEAYTSGLQSLSDAFSNYFASRDGERKGERMGWPKWRSKHKTTLKFTYTTGSFGVADPYGLKLPRIGRVHCMENVEQLTGGIQPSRMTISRHDGRWYASLLVEVPDPQPSTNLEGHVSGFGCQTHRHAQRRHHGREPAHVEGEHATATPHPTQAQPSQAGVETMGGSQA